MGTERIPAGKAARAAGQAPVQRTPAGRAFAADDVDPAQVHPGVLRPSSGGAPLPAAVKETMEATLGHDFGNVRVHHGGEAESIGAMAYTRGTNLHFAPGEYRPHTTEGRWLLAHELAHVVQQRAGRVRAPAGPVPVNEDPALEAQADAAATRAVAGPAAAPAPELGSAARIASPAGAAPVQPGKRKRARRKAQKAAHEALIQQEKEQEARRRARQWRKTMGNGGGADPGGNRTEQNLAAEAPTARSLFVNGTDLHMWDNLDDEARKKVRAEHSGLKKGDMPDLVLHPGKAREKIGDIFTANAPDQQHGQALAQAATTGKLDNPADRRALKGVYDSIISNAHKKMTKYGGGTAAVANLTQVPWADPETIRRGLIDHYGGADKVPGTLTGTINDDQSPARSKAIPIWPPPKPKKDPQGRVIRPQARHYQAWRQADAEAREKESGNNNAVLDDDGLGLWD